MGCRSSHAGPRTLSTRVRSGGRNSANYNHRNGARVDNNDLPCGWAHTRERLDVCSVRHDHQRPVGPCVQDRARVAPQLLTPISEHESVAKRWLDVDGPEIHQFCRLNAAAPGRAKDSREGYAVRPDLCAHSDGVHAPSLAEIPLSGAVIELETCRIAGS